jgi:hypothetical protein
MTVVHPLCTSTILVSGVSVGVVFVLDGIGVDVGAGGVFIVHGILLCTILVFHQFVATN